jgi:hypothetical protein
MAGEDKTASTGSEKLAADMNERFRDAVESVRKRAEATAKGLVALGTTVLTAIGIAKFSDVFPLPPGYGAYAAIGILIGSFVLMALVIVFFTLKLWRLTEPLVMASHPDEIVDLKGKQKELDRVNEVYDQVADAHNVESLSAYEAGADRLDRIAQRTSDEHEAERLADEATMIRTEVITAMGRAALAVMRYRTARAIRGRGALVVYLAFFVAVLAFGLSADWLESARAGEVKVATDCAGAQKGGATRSPPICKKYLTSAVGEINVATDCAAAQKGGATKLPTICDKYVPPVAAAAPSEASDPRAEVDKARDELSAALSRCHAAARKAEIDEKVCAPLVRALIQTVRKS